MEIVAIQTYSIFPVSKGILPSNQQRHHLSGLHLVGMVPAPSYFNLMDLQSNGDLAITSMNQLSPLITKI